MKKSDIIKTVVGGLLVVILSPFAAKLGNSAMGLFTTPEQLKITSERITKDSSGLIRQLRDSCAMFRGIVKNQHDRTADVENQIKQLKIKNHLK